MQYRLKRERGFIIRDSGVIGVPPVFEGGARINNYAALAAHLHRRRRRTGDARRPHLSRPANTSGLASSHSTRIPVSVSTAPVTNRPGLRPQTFVSQSNPMPHKY